MSAHAYAISTLSNSAGLLLIQAKQLENAAFGDMDEVRSNLRRAFEAQEHARELKAAIEVLKREVAVPAPAPAACAVPARAA